ncbi:MBL fold metallo-hydrolase [Dyadobacter sp. 22481]|uniref:MBL fold metallo-hydrolase n=1 Tax=Dyadobacter sp. 22481 TaxID=3453926 RepID=UPI003F82E5CD
MIRTCFLCVILFSSSLCIAQNKPTDTATLTDPCLDAKGNAYMDRQARAFLAEVNATLKKYPPGLSHQAHRQPHLLLLDAVLHDKYAAYRKPVQDFFHERIANTLAEIENTKVQKGAVIWKLYNMGFIIRTKTVTLAFDLVDGKSSRSDSFALSGNIMTRLIRQCDVLFVSHYHRDHADEAIARQFIDNGKPVIAPPQIWAGQPVHNAVTHLKRQADTLQELTLKSGRKLKIVLYPGHQMGETENNVPLVFTPEGLSFSHMGDQINEGKFMIDYDWIDHVTRKYHVDVLIPPSWTNEIHRIVKGFNPELVIPGHENELGHPLDDRVPFWGDSEFLQLTYPELKASSFKTLNMTWGESFHYVRP